MRQALARLGPCLLKRRMPLKSPWPSLTARRARLRSFGSPFMGSRRRSQPDRKRFCPLTMCRYVRVCLSALVLFGTTE
jgi:hypothetical protein